MLSRHQYFLWYGPDQIVMTDEMKDLDQGLNSEK